MTQFTWALAAFVLLHVGLSATGLRAQAVARIGERRYRGLFSLASAATLIWLCFAFAHMHTDASDPLNAPFWSPPPALRYATYVLVFLGFTLGVAGVLTPGPTFVGFESSVNKPESAHGVLRITRHPFLWGVALWAGGHLLANGERWALMLFGALGLMVLLGTRSIDRKALARNPESFAHFEAVTSNIPFAAILQKRNTLALGEVWWRALVGVAAFAIVGALHGVLFGAPAFVAPH